MHGNIEWPESRIVDQFKIKNVKLKIGGQTTNGHDEKRETAMVGRVTPCAPLNVGKCA
jgi:hypothetical protein